MPDDPVVERILDIHEFMLKAQLKELRRIRGEREPVSRKREGMSNMAMAMDILRNAGSPLHVTEIISQTKERFGVALSRESLVSALVKKVNSGAGVTRTAPNTFRIRKP